MNLNIHCVFLIINTLLDILLIWLVCDKTTCSLPMILQKTLTILILTTRNKTIIQMSVFRKTWTRRWQVLMRETCGGDPSSRLVKACKRFLNINMDCTLRNDSYFGVVHSDVTCMWALANPHRANALWLIC